MDNSWCASSEFASVGCHDSVILCYGVGREELSHDSISIAMSTCYKYQMSIGKIGVYVLRCTRLYREWY